MGQALITIQTDDIALRKRSTKPDMDTAWNVADTILSLVKAYDKAMHTDVVKWLRKGLGQ